VLQRAVELQRQLIDRRSHQRLEVLLAVKDVTVVVIVGAVPASS